MKIIRKDKSLMNVRWKLHFILPKKFLLFISCPFFFIDLKILTFICHFDLPIFLDLISGYFKLLLFSPSTYLKTIS